MSVIIYHRLEGVALSPHAQHLLPTYLLGRNNMSNKRRRRMPKKRVNKKHNNSAKMPEWTSSRGITIGLLPLSPILMQKVRLGVENDVGIPEKPTYTVPVGTGEHTSTQEIEHDKKSIEETPEDKEKWDDYLEHEIEFNAVLNERMAKAIMLMSVKFDMPEDDDWMKIQKILGVDVPDDPDERKQHYLETEIMGSPQDTIELMAMATIGSFDGEARAAAVSLFRGAIQKEIGNILTSAAE